MIRVIVFVSYESPQFPAGGVAAVMGKLPAATAVASALPTVVVTPFHSQSPKIAALEKKLMGQAAVSLDGATVPVSIFQATDESVWYFLRPDTISSGQESLFGGKSHPYDVPQDQLLRDSLFFGAAVVQVLPLIADSLGISRDEVEWNLVSQDWEGAVAALAFAGQASLRGRLHLTLHNSYDVYASDSDLSRIGVDSRRCPGDTVLHRALSLVEQPVFTVSAQFAEDLTDDLLQRAIMVPHLQGLLSRDPVVGVANGPFKALAVDEASLRSAAGGDYTALREWKAAARDRALGALQGLSSVGGGLVWGDQNRFRRSDNPPWVVMAGRDDPRQKGYDVAAVAVERFLELHLGEGGCPQFLFFPIPGDEGLGGLGFLRELALRFPGEVLVFPFVWAAGFRAALQGSAYALMPSLYEPFGMANEFYLDGGCVGIARATGGNLEQIVPLRASAAYSRAVEARAGCLSGCATGILFRESDSIPGASEGWAAINRADYNMSGGRISRVAERRAFAVFEAMADELRIAIEDGVRIYAQEPTLYYRMLTEGISHIRETFSWHRAGHEYARKVRLNAPANSPGAGSLRDHEPSALERSSRLVWDEARAEGHFSITAQWTGRAWKFFERESWEVRWNSVTPTLALIEKAERLCAR